MNVKGKVTNITDPLGKGRVQVYIPFCYDKDYDENLLPWAQICASDENGLNLNVGDVVWISFEGNDRANPVITGILPIAKSTDSELLLASSLGDYVIYNGQQLSLADVASLIISKNEGGNYDDITGNDNGSVSIGKLQWHADRAKNLLISIQSKNNAKFNSICSNNNCNDLISNLSISWSSYIVSKYSELYTTIKAILQTDESHKVQDDLMLQDAKSYIEHGKSDPLNITDIGALIYYADLENQYGRGSLNSCKGALYIANNFCSKPITLDSIHNGALKYSSNYVTRRTRTYNTLKELISQGKLISCNNDSTSNPISQTLNGVKLQYPVPGFTYISSPFGSRTNPRDNSSIIHTGIDISGTNANGKSIEHSKVLAVCDGSIISNYNNSYGNYIELCDSTNTYKFIYAHLSTISKSNGSVLKGDVIGTVGSTGDCTGPQLHFEMRKNPYREGSIRDYGDCIDPKPYINGKLITSSITNVVNWAISKVGCKYSMSKRLEEGYFDCSSLIYRAFKAYNITLGVNGNTAAGECNLLESNPMYGTKISDSYSPDLNLLEGDLIFWSFEINRRYKFISHVAMYIGNNQIVEAANEKDGVRIANIYSKDKIKSICRVKM